MCLLYIYSTRNNLCERSPCGVKFPWIVSDLVSPLLDLSCNVLRNLNLPIGAQNERNAELTREKFELFEDTSATTSADGGFDLHFI